MMYTYLYVKFFFMMHCNRLTILIFLLFTIELYSSANPSRVSSITGVAKLTILDSFVSTPSIKDNTILLGVFAVPSMPMHVQSMQSIPSANQIFFSTNNPLFLKKNAQLRYSVYNQNDNVNDKAKYLEKTEGIQYQFYAINSKGIPISFTIDESGTIFLQMEEKQQPGIYTANLSIDIVIS